MGAQLRKICMWCNNYGVAHYVSGVGEGGGNGRVGRRLLVGAREREGGSGAREEKRVGWGRMVMKGGNGGGGRMVVSEKRGKMDGKRGGTENICVSRGGKGEGGVAVR